MRTGNSSAAFYAPGVPPSDPDALRRFLQDELVKIQAAIAGLAAGHLDKSYAAPAKPREGDIRYADGATWNPGSGQGIYAYYGAAWHFLG